MTGEEYLASIHDMKMTAGMSSRYHQCYSRWYGRIDKGMRIAVGILAAFGLYFAIKDIPPLGVIVAIVSLIAAVALNILPFADWEKKHAELFQLWHSLRGELLVEESRWVTLKPNKSIGESELEKIAEWIRKSSQIDGLEPYPNKKFVIRCEGDEIEATYGAGIRTSEQAAAMVKKSKEEQNSLAKKA